jgi:hypothetical protein
MNYIGIIFEACGKIVEAKVFVAENSRALADKASYYGFSGRVTDVLYTGGNYQGCTGRALAVMGPYVQHEVAQSVAYSIQAAALNVDTAKYLLELRDMGEH